MTPSALRDIAPIAALVSDKLEAVESLFQERLGREVRPVDEATAHLRDGGGKRIRPLLLLLSSGLCGYRGNLDVLYSTVLEYIHTATLVHDDVLDEAMTRRGRPTLNARYGNSMTVLVGDWVYTKAMDVALDAEDPAALRILTDVGPPDDRGPGQADSFFCVMSTVHIMEAMAMDRALTRMAHEIVEQNPDAGNSRSPVSSRAVMPSATGSPPRSAPS